jgi:hypothetical protein
MRWLVLLMSLPPMPTRGIALECGVLKEKT